MALEVPLNIIHARLQAELIVIMSEHKAIAPRGFDSRRQREELHCEWDHKYDQLIALRLHAYAQGIELPPLFPMNSPAASSD